MSGVVIAGGGPAGAATALLLARAGIDVTVVERADFPRRKVCGEYQNPGAVAALARLGVLDAVRAISAPLAGVRLVLRGAPDVELAFPGEALACERAAFDALLLAAAQSAGARVVTGRVEDLTFDGARPNGVVVRERSGALRTLPARVVVGADGTGSVVARKLGLARAPRGERRFAVGGHYTGFGDLRHHVEMYVGGGAYFALNPLDDRRTNVMVVVPARELAAWSRDVDDGVRGKAAALAAQRRTFAHAARLGPRVSVGPLEHRVRAAAVPGALLVGDAAGFLNPFTGQGVLLALTGAEAAAAAVAAALRDRSSERAAFARYARERRNDFAARARLSYVVSLLLGIAPLARRAAVRLRRFPAAGTALMEALAGAGAPHAAFAPGVLGRLVL